MRLAAERYGPQDRVAAVAVDVGINGHDPFAFVTAEACGCVQRPPNLGLRRAFLELKRHDALHACEDGVHHDLAKPFDSKAAAEMSEERRLEGASRRGSLTFCNNFAVVHSVQRPENI